MSLAVQKRDYRNEFKDWTGRHLLVVRVVFIRRHARCSRSCSVDTPPLFSREHIPHALTAAEPAHWLAVSPISIYKLRKAGRIPCFRIGTCVRFDPRTVA